MRKIVTYKRGDVLGRKIKESTTLRKYYAVEERQISKYRGLKGFLLFLLFPPLALFGGTTSTEVTYELKPEYEKSN